MNPSTTILRGTRTITFDGRDLSPCPEDLYRRYEQLLEGQHLGWTEHLRFRRLLGTGGQGVVYLTDRRGCDDFTLPVALKVLSPERFSSQSSYDNAMNRIAAVACSVAKIQHDALLDVQNFVERNRITQGINADEIFNGINEHFTAQDLVNTSAHWQLGVTPDEWTAVFNHLDVDGFG